MDGEDAAVRYSVVVPLYRGHDTIDELCAQLIGFFESRDESFEIILVDDASSDGSWDRAIDLAHEDSRIVGARLTRNFGQHNAVLAGFRLVRGEYVVTLDEDLQHPPSEIEKLIECQAINDADVVYGVPEARQQRWWRRVGAWIAMMIPRRVMGVDFEISSFRLVRSEIAREVTKATRYDVIIDVYLAWLTERFAAVKIRHEPSARGSSYSPLMLVSVLLRLVYNYTVLPLRISTFLGILLAVLSLGLALYFVIVYLSQNVGVPGFTALIVSILFSTGVILIGIGMVSEYLARTFLHVIGKPQAVIRITTRELDREPRADD